MVDNVHLHCRSCQIYEKRKEESSRMGEVSRAHFVLAKYADAQYQNVVKYMRSDIFAEKCDNLDKVRVLLQ
jgi:uncharacterized protein Veg